MFLVLMYQGKGVKFENTLFFSHEIALLPKNKNNPISLIQLEVEEN